MKKTKRDSKQGETRQGLNVEEASIVDGEERNDTDLQSEEMSEQISSNDQGVKNIDYS